MNAMRRNSFSNIKRPISLTRAKKRRHSINGRAKRKHVKFHNENPKYPDLYLVAKQPKQKRLQAGGHEGIRGTRYGQLLKSKFHISIKKEDKLVFNHKAHMTKIAVVGENFIEYQKGIFLEGYAEPFVFIQNSPLVPLVDQMNNKQLKEGLKIIQSYIPRSNPMEVLKWMLYNRILCVNNI